MAIDAAVEAGIERIVYTSFLAAAPDATFTFARDHFHTEQYIRSTGLGFGFLRSSLYLDVVPFFAGDDGVIRVRPATAASPSSHGTTSRMSPLPCCWTNPTTRPTTSPGPRR